MATPITREQAAAVMARALARSIQYACTVHVNAIVALANGQPIVTCLREDDWYADGATIATYTNGRLHD